MATLNDDEKQADPNQQPTTGGTTAAPTGSGQGVAGQNQMAPGASQVQQNQAPTGSGYTDVGTYLDANRAGSADLGNRVSSNLTNKYNQTKAGAEGSYNQFAGDVNKGYTQENTDLINQVAANPTSAASNKDQLAAFQGQLNDTYAGPQNWADFGTQQGKVNEANQYANLSKTPGGLNVYAQEAEGQTGGPQSQGINQLDSLLLGGSPEAMGQVQSAADPYKSLNDYINTQNTAGSGLVSGAQNTAQNASQHALDAFTGANGTLTNLNSTITQNTAQKLAEAQATNSNLKADLASGNMTPADLQAAGITQPQWDALKAAMTRANTSQYMTGHNFGAASATQAIDLMPGLQQQDPTQMINAGTTATPDQYAQMAAIQQLLGSKNPQGNAINPDSASLAGTYNPANLNQFNYQGALDYSTQVGDAERQAAQEQANQLTAAADLAHAQSQHGGGFFGGITSTLQHPLSAVGSMVNPLSWVANVQNLSKGQAANPTNINPIAPSTTNQATPIAQQATPSNIEKYLAANAANAAV
jgi:hypothetical protein